MRDPGKTIKRARRAVFVPVLVAGALLVPGLDVANATSQRPNVTCREGRLIGTVVGPVERGLPRGWIASPLRRGLGRRGWGAAAARRSGYAGASGIGS